MGSNWQEVEELSRAIPFAVGLGWGVVGVAAAAAAAAAAVVGSSVDSFGGFLHCWMAAG